MQALVQILDNAREAMPAGGTLRVESRATLGDKLILVSMAYVEESDVPAFNPKVVFVNEKNQPVKKKK